VGACAKRLRRQLILLAFLLPVALSGCVAIPTGKVWVTPNDYSSYWGRRERTTERYVALEAATLQAKLEAADDALGVVVNAKYLVERKTTGGKKKRLYREKLVIGLFPGWRALQLNDEESYGVEPGFELGLITVLLNCYFGLPTVASWFTEWAADWEPPEPRFATVSLIGYAKTREPTDEVDDGTTVRALARTEPVAGVSVVSRARRFGYSRSAWTDAAGRARFDLGNWPVITSSNVELEVSASGVDRHRFGVTPATLSLSVPAAHVGRKVRRALVRGECPSAVLYTDTGPLDFSLGAPDATPAPNVRVAVVPQGPGRPDRVGLKVTVENKGKGALCRLLATTRSAQRSLDGQMVLFGKVGPGTSVTRTLVLPVAKHLETASYPVSVVFREAHGRLPKPVPVSVAITRLPRPQLAFAWYVADDTEGGAAIIGNGDGLIQLGETVELVVAVRNNGPVCAVRPAVTLVVGENGPLKSTGGPARVLGDLAPGAVGVVRYRLWPTQQAAAGPAALTLSVREESFGEPRGRTIGLTVGAGPGPQVKRKHGVHYVTAPEAVLLTGADAGAAEYARAARGTPLPVTGELPGWLRVDPPGTKRHAGAPVTLWVERRSLGEQRAAVAIRPTTITQFTHLPPDIVFVRPNSNLRTAADRVELVIDVVQQTGGLADVRLDAGPATARLFDVSRWVHSADTPAGEGVRRRLAYRPFLAMGRNLFRVSATDTRGRRSRRTLVITRTPAPGGPAFAVVIGAALPGCVDDAKSVAQALRRCGRFKRENVLLVTGKPGDGEATSAARIGRHIEDLAGEVRRGGLAFFYFAGSASARGSDVYLLPGDRARGPGIALNSLAARLARSDAARAVVVLDVFRGAGRGAPAADFRRLRSRPRVALFLPCSDGQASTTEGAASRSVYTQQVVASLGACAADTSQAVTARELQRLIETGLSEWREQSGGRQKPRLVGPYREDVLIFPGKGD